MVMSNYGQVGIASNHYRTENEHHGFAGAARTVWFHESGW